MLDVDVAVVALGAVRNTEWLRRAGLAADARGVVCDASCRVFSDEGVVLDDIFVAGDIARWPHPLFDGQLIAVEHWDNAVRQAAVAAHNMVRPPAERSAHKALPAFWSNQFGLNIKSVGLPSVADELVVTQGSVAELRFVAVYGGGGRTVAAVSVNAPLWVDYYQALIAARAPFHRRSMRLTRQQSRSSGRPGSRRGACHPQPDRRCHRSWSEFASPVTGEISAPARDADHCGVTGSTRAHATASALRRGRSTEDNDASGDRNWPRISLQILDPVNRPNPYPLYRQLQQTPVALLADGFFAVSTYAAIAALLHDPRMSKDQRKTEIPPTGAQRIEPRPFLFSTCPSTTDCGG